MLDKLTSAVLGAVNAQTNGSYKVLEADELIGALPEKLKTDASGIENALRYLCERGTSTSAIQTKIRTACVRFPREERMTRASVRTETAEKRNLKASFCLPFSARLRGRSSAGVWQDCCLCLRFDAANLPRRCGG